MKKFLSHAGLLSVVAFVFIGFFVFTTTTVKATSIPPVLINEFLTNPSSESEWYELLNTTGSDIDLTGWYVRSTVGDSSVFLSGTIPAMGISVFSATSDPANDAGDVLSLRDSGDNQIYAVTYGTYNPPPIAPPHSAAPGVDQSAFLTIPSTWAVTSSPTKGWYNNAVYYPCPMVASTTPPTLSSIAECLAVDGIVTNLDAMADPSAATDLYFEKRTDASSSTTAFGRLTFAGPLNLTNASTTAILQDLGAKMEAAAGSMSFDAQTALDLKNAGASIAMYHVGDIGGYNINDLNLSDLIVRDDDGNIIATTSRDYPELSLLATSTDNGGTFAFSTSHFTQFGFNPNVVYVDSANDGAEDGSEAHPYNTIQEGVDAVSTGGTVRVASGNYVSTSTITVSTPGITITGPTPVASSSRPYVQNTQSRRVIDINVDNVSVVGLKLEQDSTSTPGHYAYNYPVVRIGSNSLSANNSEINNNEIAGGYIGVAVNDGSAGVNVQNNDIHNNEAYGVSIWSQNTIQNNSIHNNGWGIGLACGGDGCGGGYNLSNTTISGNSIYQNDGGIRYSAGDQEGTVTVGPGNDIHNNGEGINVSGNAYNLFVNNNKIHDNTLPASGLHVDNDSSGMDATKNWWGNAAGPVVTTDGTTTLNVGGEGETINISNSTFVFYRPFCTNDSCSTMSTISTTPDDLAPLFETGVFVVPFGEDLNDVSSIRVAEDLTLTLPNGSSVEIPAGVTITEESGSFDPSGLSASEVSTSTLTGLGSGVVAQGALEWGIPNLHLQFNPAITLNIFVGTELNGQTLSVKRSTDGVTWTSDGIVAPATCRVAGGICSFQATKASTYVSIPIPSSGRPSGAVRHLVLATTTPSTVATPTMSVSQFIQLLISLGIIPADKILLIKIIFGLI